MKRLNAIPVMNKTEFMKINSHNFIENEKYNSELVHEKNVGKIVSLPSPKSEEPENISQQQRTDNLKEAPEDVYKKIEDSRRAMKEFAVVTESSTDYIGATPKRYVTQCYLKPTSVPCWYRESLFLTINSTKKTHTTKVYIKQRLLPVRWVEHMSTEVKTRPKFIQTEANILLDEPPYHYISLEPQQEAVKVTSL